MNKRRNFFIKSNRLSLMSKFIIAVIITTLIPMLITTFVMSAYIKNIMMEQVISSIESGASQISDSLDQMIAAQLYSISNVVMNNSHLYELLTEDYNNGSVQRYMDALNFKKMITSGYGKIYQDIHLAAVIGRNNVLFNLSLPSYQNDSLITLVNEIKDTTRGAGTSIMWFGLSDNVFTNRTSDDIRENKIIIAAMNIFMPTTGEYVGAQIYAFAERLIYEKYKDTNLNANGHVFILNRDGDLISASGEQYITGDIELPVYQIQSILDNRANTFKLDDDTLITKKDAELSSWKTVGYIPTHVITDKIDNIFNMLWLIIVLCVLACLMTFISISKAIIRPIKNIIDSIKKFEMGEMESYVEVNEKSELSLLETYYNRMIDKINRHIVYEYEQDKRKKQLELDVLMSQINSHFLSNTLESIIWKARAADALDIAKMASSLGRFFKLSSSKANTFVTVAEEVAHINSYVSIQKIRYGDRFDFTLTLDDKDAVGIERLKTLKILLQPLVENSIMHATEGLERTVEINVRIYLESNRLIFEVCDDGTGISEQELVLVKENMKTGKSIGLRNVRERIKLYFEDELPESGLVLESEQGKGTAVKLILPVINEL